MIFTIHMQPQQQFVGAEITRFDGLVVVPESHANWALLFPPFWLFHHRLWFALGVYGLIVILSMALLATPLAPAVLFLSGLPGVYLFLEGHQLRRAKLEAEGYALVDVVEASDERTALERFLCAYEGPELGKSTVSPTMSTLTTKSHPKSEVFGMFPQGEM